MSAPIGVEARQIGKDLAALDRDLKAAGALLRRDLRRGVRRGADIAAAGVRARTSWSTRIPGAVRVRARYGRNSASVAVEVDPKKAPEAAPLNHGGRPGTFRVPLFGDKKHWFPHDARPFFEPAIAEKRPAADKAIDDVLTGVQRRAGYR